LAVYHTLKHLSFCLQIPSISKYADLKQLRSDKFAEYSAHLSYLTVNE